MEANTIILIVLLLIALVIIFYLLTKRKKTVAPEISPQEASQIVKKHAEKQKIAVELSQEQVDDILNQWRKLDITNPAQINFIVKDKEIGDFRLASAPYFSDTCCA